MNETNDLRNAFSDILRPPKETEATGHIVKQKLEVETRSSSLEDSDNVLKPYNARITFASPKGAVSNLDFTCTTGGWCITDCIEEAIAKCNAFYSEMQIETVYLSALDIKQLELLK